MRKSTIFLGISYCLKVKWNEHICGIDKTKQSHTARSLKSNKHIECLIHNVLACCFDFIASDQQLTKKKTQLEINYDRTEIGESCDTNKKFFFFIFKIEIKIELQLTINEFRKQKSKN